jgi:hypothetical protein
MKDEPIFIRHSGVHHYLFQILVSLVLLDALSYVHLLPFQVSYSTC